MHLRNSTGTSRRRLAAAAAAAVIVGVGCGGAEPPAIGESFAVGDGQLVIAAAYPGCFEGGCPKMMGPGDVAWSFDLTPGDDDAGVTGELSTYEMRFWVEDDAGVEHELAALSADTSREGPDNPIITTMSATFLLPEGLVPSQMHFDTGEVIDLSRIFDSA